MMRATNARAAFSCCSSARATAAASSIRKGSRLGCAFAVEDEHPHLAGARVRQVRQGRVAVLPRETRGEDVGDDGGQRFVRDGLERLPGGGADGADQVVRELVVAVERHDGVMPAPLVIGVALGLLPGLDARSRYQRREVVVGLVS